MPKIRRQNLPQALYDHLLDRVQQRSVSAEQLRLMLQWMDAQPEVPEGRWFKRFPSQLICILRVTLGQAFAVIPWTGPDRIAAGDFRLDYP